MSEKSLARKMLAGIVCWSILLLSACSAFSEDVDEFAKEKLAEKLDDSETDLTQEFNHPFRDMASGKIGMLHSENDLNEENMEGKYSPLSRNSGEFALREAQARLAPLFSDVRNKRGNTDTDGYGKYGYSHRAVPYLFKKRDQEMNEDERAINRFLFRREQFPDQQRRAVMSSLFKRQLGESEESTHLQRKYPDEISRLLTRLLESRKASEERGPSGRAFSALFK